MNIAPERDTPAVHGTEMYGIVGQTDPNANSEKITRDKFVTDVVLTFAAGDYSGLWVPVTDKPEVKDIGIRPWTGNVHYQEIMEFFNGIGRE